MTDQPPASKPHVDWAAAFAGAAAAVTVAVLLSTLGAAGTLIGAALGSVVATVSTALYKQGIESSRRRMAAVQATALTKVGRAQDDVRRAAESRDPVSRADNLAKAEEHLDRAAQDLGTDESGDSGVPGDPDETLDETATRELPVGVGVEAPAQPEPRFDWRALPWARLALVALALFVVAVILISLFEVFAGRSVSSLTGGTDNDKRTSITGIFGDSADDKPGKHRRPDNGTSQTPTEEAPTEAPTSDTTPSDPVTTPTTTSPTEAPSTDQTTAPTEAPSTEPTAPPTEPATPDAGR